MRIQFTNFVSSSVFPCFFIYWVSLFTGYIKTDNHFLIAPLFFTVPLYTELQLLILSFASYSHLLFDSFLAELQDLMNP